MACSASSTRIGTTRATFRSARGSLSNEARFTLQSRTMLSVTIRSSGRDLMVTKAVLTATLGTLAVAALPARVHESGAAPIRIVLVGDSTVTDDSGWGPGLTQPAGPRP